MTQYVKLPDGSFASFPDDIGDAEIEKVLSNQNQDIKQKTLQEQIADKEKQYGRSSAIMRQGGLETLANLGEFAGNIPKYAADFVYPGQKVFGNVNLKQYLPQGIPENELTTGEQIAKKIPEFAMMALAPEASAIKLAGTAGKGLSYFKDALEGSRALKQGIPQSLIAASQAPEGNRLESGTIAGISGAPIESALKWISSLSKQALTPKKAAADFLSKRINEADVKVPLEASKRIGIDITPAEATRSDVLGLSQKFLGRTPYSEQKMTGFAKQRSEDIKREAETFASNLYDPKTEKEVKNFLYEKTKNDLVPKEAIPYDNKIFQLANEKIKNSKVYQEKLKGVDESSIGYLHQVKRKLDSLERVAKKKDANAAFEIGATRDKLNDVLYSSNPDFSKAQEIASREITKRKFSDFFNKRDVNPNNLSKFFSDKKNFESLKSKLSEHKPEAIRQLEDLKTIVDKISQAKTKQKIVIEQRKFKLSNLWNKPAGKLVDALGKNKYENSMTDLITNNKWKDEISKLSKLSDKEKLANSFINLLSKAGAQGAAKESQ